VQQKIFGDRPGVFHGERDAWLWMPKGLLEFGEPEINYVAARGKDTLYLALMNQSPQAVSATLRLNAKLVPWQPGKTYPARWWRENQPTPGMSSVDPAGFRVELSPRGLTALAIQGLPVTPRFQQKLVGASPAWKQDFASLELGGTRAMLFHLGPELKSVYVYSQADPAAFKRVTLHYATGGEWRQLTDAAFPFEFTVPLPSDATGFQFKVEGITPAGEKRISDTGSLEQGR
jgi:hypothetical protein